MSDVTQYALVSTAVATALFHTLIPDHWLPFVLIGRARGWSAGQTSAIAAVSATIHVIFSILLGFGALWLGQVAAHAVGETLESASQILLIGFGLTYAFWAWRKGGHFHPGGARFHREPVDGACDGDEGPEHPDHLHYHADMELIEGNASPSAWWLAFIVGVNPCLLLFPLLVKTAERGPGDLLLVILAYSGPTVLLMVGLSALGVASTRRIPVPGAARYMEAASGLLIAGLGVLFLFLGH